LDQGRADEFQSNGAPSVVMDAEAEGPIFFGLAHRDAKRSPRSRQPTISAVIPAKNEAGNLPWVLSNLPSMVTEVVLVDGRSSDDTIEVARSLRPDIRIVVQCHRGKGDAVACGFAVATGDIIVMLDADGSADPAEIPAFVDTLVAGADFAKGSRSLPGGGSEDLTRIRGLGNGTLTRIVNLLFGCRYTDLCYGYNAFWRDCLPLLNIDSTGFEIETQINVRAARVGLEVREVPSFELSRGHGFSNLSPVRDGLRVLRTILSERMRPVHPPGPAWAALTGGLELEAPRLPAQSDVNTGIQKLLQGAADA
jgi:glycosyltransferase involved in cell wall biosynthesis